MERQPEGSETDPDDADRRALWNKAGTIQGMDPDVYRHDDYGNIIKYKSFNDRQSDYGWEPDHPPAPRLGNGQGGRTEVRPLHWRVKADQKQPCGRSSGLSLSTASASAQGG